METTKLDRLIQSQLENLESKIRDLNIEYDKVFRFSLNTTIAEKQLSSIQLMRMISEAEKEAKIMHHSLAQYNSAKLRANDIYTKAIKFKESI